MPHQQLGLQSLHRLQGNAHNDDDGGAADRQVPDPTHEVAGDDGQQSHNAEIHSTKDNDLVDDLLDEISGGSARTEAGNEAAVLLQVVGYLHRIILNGGVEPAEEEDHQEVHDRVEPGSRAPHMIVPPAAGMARKGADGSGQGADGLCEDDGHNTGHADLDGQIGVLTAVDLAAYHTLGVLDGDPTLGVVHEDDEQDQSGHADQHDDDLPPDHGGQGADHAGNAGDDIGEQDHGDAVADTELGDLLTQPHHEGRACGEGQNDDHGGHKALLSDDGEAGSGVVEEHLVVRPANQQTQTNGGVPGNPGNLLLAFLTLLLCHPLQSGNGNGQQLDDNGSVDVGLNAQREDRSSAESGAGHCVVQSQDRGRQHAVKVVGKCSRIDIRDRNHVACPVNQQNEQCEDDLLAKLRDLPRILEGL